MDTKLIIIQEQIGIGIAKIVLQLSDFIPGPSQNISRFQVCQYRSHFDCVPRLSNLLMYTCVSHIACCITAAV